METNENWVILFLLSTKKEPITSLIAFGSLALTRHGTEPLHLIFTVL